MLNNERPAGTGDDRDLQVKFISSPPADAKPNVVCSLLSCEKQVLDFGLRCYNDGLYDGQMNLKGGESILVKFRAFLTSLVELPP